MGRIVAHVAGNELVKLGRPLYPSLRPRINGEMKKSVRQRILEHIATNAGFRLANVQNGTASTADKELLDEALGFRSLCLFSNISDDDLRRAWDDSNLEYSL